MYGLEMVFYISFGWDRRILTMYIYIHMYIHVYSSPAYCIYYHIPSYTFHLSGWLKSFSSLLIELDENATAKSIKLPVAKEYTKAIYSKRHRKPRYRRLRNFVRCLHLKLHAPPGNQENQKPKKTTSFIKKTNVSVSWDYFFQTQFY